MTSKRKFVPVDDDVVGMVHPIDGPLDREGSEWTLDAFTHRRLLDGSIAHFERPVIEAQTPVVETQRPVVTKPSSKVTSATPKIETR